MAARISLDRIGEIMKAVLLELQAMGGEARLRDLFRATELKLALNDYERATLEKSGFIRWQSVVHFYSINFVKSGFLRKEGGRWYLTETGREALKLSPGNLIRRAGEGYDQWASTRQANPPVEKAAEDSEAEQIERQTGYEQALEQARSEIEEHINAMGPYDFQRLVAELLMAMGYHVPFVAPQGPDGGVDVVAYKDPLGTTAPRIRVQVKHREQKVTVHEVRELEGVLKREGDIGLIVSSGGFTAEAEREIRSSHRHIETMDLDRVIRLWQESYDRVRETGKRLLPLVKLYFLAPTEE
jgi:restriction system protein